MAATAAAAATAAEQAEPQQRRCGDAACFPASTGPPLEPTKLVGMREREGMTIGRTLLIPPGLPVGGQLPP